MSCFFSRNQQAELSLFIFSVFVRFLLLVIVKTPSLIDD